ncbi:MAG: hypothetical protein O3C57_07225 [Verrucomicrobia bacterium]|nr:hypothetical protein [Verrucomicrobiota bacterium]
MTNKTLGRAVGCICKPEDWQTTPLNADAIYAALTFLQGYAESEEGEADFRELLDRKSEKVESFRALAKKVSKGTEDRQAVFRPIPSFEFTPELCESIYPGEQVNVELGLGYGRLLIWGPPFLTEIAAQGDGPTEEAVRRFIADRAN